MEIRNMNIAELRSLRSEQMDIADKAIAEKKPDEANEALEQIKELDERIKALEEKVFENKDEDKGEERMGKFRPQVAGLTNNNNNNNNQNKSEEVRGFERYLETRATDGNIKLDDGVAVVPETIKTEILEKTENVLKLSDLVSTVNVDTGSGEIPFLRSNAMPLPTVDELEESPALGLVPYTPIKFKVNTHRAYITVSNEMREDNASSLLNMVKQHFARSVVATDNKLIMDQLNTLEATTSSDGVDAIKRAINVDLLANGYQNLTILVNSSVYNTLDTMKDNNGRYILQNTLKDSPYKSINGVPVIVVPDTQLEGNKVFVGALKDAVALFLRSEWNVMWEEYLRYGVSLSTAIRRDAKIIDDQSVKAIELTFGEDIGA